MKDKAYRTYVTDALRLISESTAKYGGGPYLSKRFADIIDPPKKTKAEIDQENKSTAEIVDEIWAGIRGKKEVKQIGRF